MTAMNIDITELTAYEIQQVLTNYPRGRLVIKYERVFWESGSIEPVSKKPREDAARHLDPRQHPRANNSAAKSFEAMSDTLGSMVCPPSVY